MLGRKHTHEHTHTVGPSPTTNQSVEGLGPHHPVKGVFHLLGQTHALLKPDHSDKN